MIETMMKKQSVVTLLLMLLLGFGACSEDEIDTPFSLTQHELKLEVGETTELAFNSGSGTYSLSNDNSVVTEAIIIDRKLSIKALTAGTSTLTITDENSSEQEKLKVLVTEKPTAIPEGVIVKDHIVVQWDATLIPADGKVVLPEGIVGIAGEAFYQTPIQKITFPTTLKFIGKDAFAYCNGLKEVILPEGIDSIGESAFYQCHNITQVFVPRSVKKIAPNVFTLCTSLHETTLQNGLELIGESMFYGCKSLDHITLPNTTKTIKDNAFSACTNLRTIELPIGLTTIENTTFKECTDTNFSNPFMK